MGYSCDCPVRRSREMGWSQYKVSTVSSKDLMYADYSWYIADLKFAKSGCQMSSHTTHTQLYEVIAIVINLIMVITSQYVHIKISHCMP